MAEDKTVIVEAGRRGSGAGWLIAVVLIIALIVGVMLAMRASDSEVTKNSAITSAAQDVGSAANKVGDAAQDAADGASK